MAQECSKLDELDVSVYQTIGRRPEQQDTLKVIEGFNNSEWLTLCIVNDGHGGCATAVFLYEQYPIELEKVMEEQRRLPKLERVGFLKALGLALQRCIDMWDYKCFGNAAKSIYDDASKHKFFVARNLQKWEDEGLEAGSTFVCVLFDMSRKRAHVVNLGDSRACWILDESKIGSSVDHGIKKTMATIPGFTFTNSDGRLQEDLAMSRSVGDNTEPLYKVVSRQFDSQTIDLKGLKSFRFVIASDGLFDVLPDCQTVLYETFENAEAIAQHGLETIESNMRHSGLKPSPNDIQFEDNTSIIYVKFPNAKVAQTMEHAQQLATQLATVMQQLNIVPNSTTKSSDPTSAIMQFAKEVAPMAFVAENAFQTSTSSHVKSVGDTSSSSPPAAQQQQRQLAASTNSMLPMRTAVSQHQDMSHNMYLQPESKTVNAEADSPWQVIERRKRSIERRTARLQQQMAERGLGLTPATRSTTTSNLPASVPSNTPHQPYFVHPPSETQQHVRRPSVNRVRNVHGKT